jgi:Domain of unknown function (DUF6438)
MLAGACVLIGASAPQSAFGQAAHRSRPQPPPAPAPVTPPLITLERTGCHGQCAEYKLSFYEDGQVVYEGKANVSKAGRWHATVTKDILSDLLTEFQRTSYSTLSDKYPAGLTETSTAATSLRTGDKVKTVTHEVGSPFPPAALIALEDRIDASVQSVDWTR